MSNNSMPKGRRVTILLLASIGILMAVAFWIASHQPLRLQTKPIAWRERDGIGVRGLAGEPFTLYAIPDVDGRRIDFPAYAMSADYFAVWSDRFKSIELWRGGDHRRTLIPVTCEPALLPRGASIDVASMQMSSESMFLNVWTENGPQAVVKCDLATHKCSVLAGAVEARAKPTSPEYALRFSSNTFGFSDSPRRLNLDPDAPITAWDFTPASQTIYAIDAGNLDVYGPHGTQTYSLDAEPFFVGGSELEVDPDASRLWIVFLKPLDSGSFVAVCDKKGRALYKASESIAPYEMIRPPISSYATIAPWLTIMTGKPIRSEADYDLATGG